MAREKKIDGILNASIIIMFFVMVTIIATNFLGPKIGCLQGDIHSGSVSFSKGTYNRVTEEIRSLIAKEDPKYQGQHLTSKLRFFLAYEPYSGPCSGNTIEYCSSWWANNCQSRVHRLLNRAYSNATKNHDFAARFYLSLADYLNSNSDCYNFDCGPGHNLSY